MNTFQFQKLSEHARTPTRGSKQAAGLDLYAAEESIINAKSRGLVKTDIAIKVPEGTYGRVAPRSGLALKCGIDVGAGVVDEDYRGNIGVVLFNFGDTDFKVNKGDRIAQLIFEKIMYAEPVEVESLDETKRGAGGFGSSF
jgi:dUTP pyrophosphatase